MRIALDMSSIMWTCLLVGTDSKAYKVEFNGKQVSVNTADYGFNNAMNSMVATLNQNGLTPMQAILVFEGMNSKAPRLLYHKGYKARDDRPPEMYHEFQQLKEKLLTTWRGLGAIGCSQDFAEGDDTLAWLAKHIKEDLIISTNDNDMSALNGVNEYGATIMVNVNGLMGQNKYGEFDFKYITLYKALVGDTSDKIPGIVGFGPAAWKNLYARFGESGCDELIRLAELGSLDELAEESEKDKQIKQLFDGADSFIMSYRLAKLRPEWVNTCNYQLQWFPGMVMPSDHAMTKRWGQHSKLVTNETWNVFSEWFLAMIAKETWISLDIETSTPDESDDWLEAQGNPKGVDVIGSELTGMSLTFGPNKAYTVYIPVRHKDTDNVPSEKLRALLEAIVERKVELVIQNMQFELTVLNHEWPDAWPDNCNLLPNVLDTKFEASYVDENGPLGLKALSKRWLGYDQVDYNTATTVDGVQYKMKELTGQHVTAYACDDTITTAALHNFFMLFMQLEGTYEIYKQVEIDASYLHCQSFIHGTKISVGKLKELESDDDASYSEAEKLLHTYLITKGWEGSLAPTVSAVDAASIKLAYLQITGKPLETALRTPDKLYALMPDQPALVDLFKAGDFESINKLIAMNFTAKPVFNPGSPKQMAKLLYEVMAMPIKVYNKPTDIARKAGAIQGSPKTDSLAMSYALMDADTEVKEALISLRTMRLVATRKGLYYDPFPYFVHWKTGRIHSSHNQCATNTRRASSSTPNLQQLAKAQKVEGFDPHIREAFIPHKQGAVIVSMDFVSQEILLLAEWSRDPSLEAVFTGNPPLDMHSMTGSGILNSQAPDGVTMTYAEFVAAVNDHEHQHYKLCKRYRALGKAINFSGQYRVAAPKMASMLFVTESEAQTMIDAKAEAFPVAEQWALDEMAKVKVSGTVRSLKGAVRHLAPALTSSDRYEASKADRQALSFLIQGSAAEMTKEAEGRMWLANLERRFDCEIIAPIHDEIVASCAIKDLYEFIPEMHRCMVANYAGMRLPIRSSVSFGLSFGDQIEIGTDPTREAIARGLAEVET